MAPNKHKQNDVDPQDSNNLTEDDDLDADDPSENGDDESQFLVHHFEIKRNLERRLDVYLHQRLKRISRSRVQKLIDLGHITVNNRKPKASTVVKMGDLIEVRLPPIAVKTIEPQPVPLDVLYEDEDIIVLNKQAGVIVHPARSHTSGTLVNGLAYRFKEQQEAKGETWQPRNTRGLLDSDRKKVKGLSNVGAKEFRPGIIHRLDKNTTGVLVVAKQDETHWAIAKQFENRSTLKSYLTVVHGNFDEPAGAVEEPIGKHPTIHEAFAVRHDHLSKHALTLYRVREQYEGYSLVEIELKTGRTHQIRVHMTFLGHPIAGDIVYGGEPIGPDELQNPPVAAGSRKFLTFARTRDEGLKIEAQAKQRTDIIIAHPALHAAMLSFEHPTTRERPVFTAPLHEPMATLVRELRKSKRDDLPVITKGTWIDLSKAVPEDL